MKKTILVFLMASIAFGSEGQVFKKLKDKVNNVMEKKADPANDTKSTGSNKHKDKWCLTDTIANTYSKAYSSAGDISILYDESCVGLGEDASGYTMVLAERVGNKTMYVIIENGVEKGRYPEMKNEYLPCRGKSKGVSTADSRKYLIPDSTKYNVAAVKGQTVKTQEINEKNAQRGMELAKQSEEYKKMSPEEKKQFDEMMKNMPQQVTDYNKNVANKTYEIPGYNGASGSYLSGYRIVVNKKEYGKFSSVSFLSVSPDEKNVFAICTDMKAGQLFLVNDKKINLQQKGFSGIGKMLASPDGNKAVYLELKQKSAAEMEKDMKDYEHAKYVYRGLKSDGTGFELTVTGNLGDADFKMANNGAVVYVNSKTGEIFNDGKPAGKFIFNNNESDGFSAETLLIGDTPDKICYYASDGSLNYPGGIKKDMGIIFPAVIRLSGKTYISWFRQCNNEIYIGKMIF